MEQEPQRAIRDLLAAGLAELGLAAHVADPLAELSEIVARSAERLNLTGHRGPESIARRLILDALALGAALDASLPARVADLGSGAGFPGLPLAIAWPDAELTLVESRERRHYFQRLVIRSLRLPNARAIRGRAEELPAEQHDLVLAQAMAQPATALAWMLRWARPGGLLVLPQSDDGAAMTDIPAGVEPLAVRRYVVPLGGPARAIWIGRRSAVMDSTPAAGV